MDKSVLVLDIYRIFFRNNIDAIFNINSVTQAQILEYKIPFFHFFFVDVFAALSVIVIESHLFEDIEIMSEF